MKQKNLNTSKGKVVVAAGIGDYSAEEICLIDKCRFAVIDILEREGYAAVAFDIVENEFIRSPEIVVEKIKKIKPDFVFNLFEGFHGRAGSEADFVRMLESANIKFTGNGSAALRTCLDKYTTKKILEKNGINTPRGTLFRDIADLAETEHVFPMFVKPAFEDASLGICSASFVSDLKSLKKTIKKKLDDFSEGLLVEEFISGREYNVGFFGGENFELVGVSVLDYEQYPDCISYLNYSGKWEEETPEYENFMPRIIDSNDPAYRNDVVEISRRAGQLLGCSRYFRVDLREKDGRLYVLDVNPNPDISPDSGFGRQARANDLAYADVVIKIAGNYNL
ncbi:MAG: ATP-grasp domain-containing protein [Candidatus Omnitrophica bacterium]|nr:ATP-grasp domain-containing protein [Candidatus Omnitrophota bacterium]